MLKVVCFSGLGNQYKANAWFETFIRIAVLSYCFSLLSLCVETSLLWTYYVVLWLWVFSVRPPLLCVFQVNWRPAVMSCVFFRWTEDLQWWVVCFRWNEDLRWWVVCFSGELKTCSDELCVFQVNWRPAVMSCVFVCFPGELKTCSDELCVFQVTEDLQWWVVCFSGELKTCSDELCVFQVNWRPAVMSCVFQVNWRPAVMRCVFLSWTEDLKWWAVFFFFSRRIEDLQFQIEEEVISKDDLEVSCLLDPEPCLNLTLLFLLGAKYAWRLGKVTSHMLVLACSTVNSGGQLHDILVPCMKLVVLV